MTTRVINIHDIKDARHAIAEGSLVIIDRSGKWGNKFGVGKGYTREESISFHRQSVLADPLLMMAIREELQGKTLACHCKPKECHGDTYAWVADMPEEEFERLLIGVDTGLGVRV